MVFATARRRVFDGPVAKSLVNPNKNHPLISAPEVQPSLMTALPTVFSRPAPFEAVPNSEDWHADRVQDLLDAGDRTVALVVLL